jgi:hypothetical protein
MPAGRAHFHLLVGCGSALTATLVNIWRQPNYGGTWVSKHKANQEKLEARESAYVLPYDRSINASFYLFKTMGSSGLGVVAPAWSSDQPTTASQCGAIHADEKGPGSARSTPPADYLLRPLTSQIDMCF